MCRLTAEELRPGGDATLFVFGGAGGETDELRPVVGGLSGDPRVVALAFAAEPGTADSIETMAAAAVDLLRADQPHGPYQLLGYSFGGLLALESARLLTDAGEAVAFVGLMDSLFDQRHWPAGLFVRATARRAAHPCPGPRRPAAGSSPAGAVRPRRLAWRGGCAAAHRARGRRTRAGVATVQDANLAVMARVAPPGLRPPGHAVRGHGVGLRVRPGRAVAAVAARSWRCDGSGATTST